MNETYYAKSKNKQHDAITNGEHCRKVAALAKRFGDAFGKGFEAAIAGTFHDFGKYGQTFQDVLKGKRQNIDHAFPGAAFLLANSHLFCTESAKSDAKPIIESVAGHHDGLISIDLEKRKLQGTYESAKSDCCPSGKYPSLHGSEEMSQAYQAFCADFPDFNQIQLPKRTSQNKIEDMLDTRMLFSCLVDADYSVSAADDDPSYLEKNSRESINAEAALRALYQYLTEIKQQSKADETLNQLRDRVFALCGNAGEESPGLFTLTAPTGVGKTLAMLHFALKHCAVHSMRRIIVVLPFLTLAEQTEREYRHIFPDVLVDHSQSNLPDDMRILAERWDAPVIITTSVRFFESLFADQPTDCRKLHHIANSVVLFDESQSLPSDLAPATIKAVNALCKKYQCSMVFSTATQPDFAALHKTDSEVAWKPMEMIKGCQSIFEQTRRVQVQWRLTLNAIPDDQAVTQQIASEMAKECSVCAIVNLRRYARELFEQIAALHGHDGLYLITTDLCPAHRLEVVKEIKRRQKEQIPCIVVATQCIEAGVDLDFDVMYRSLAPLEALIQAAGRCNRNHRLAAGKMIVFEQNDYPWGDAYEHAATIVKELWADDPDLDINDLTLVSQYYHRLFQSSRRNSKLEEALKTRDYAEVSKAYRLINHQGKQVIVPWSGEKDLFNEIQDEIQKTGTITRALMHKAAPITVNTFEEKAIQTFAAPLKIRVHGVFKESGYYMVNNGFFDRYDQTKGLDASSRSDDCMIG